MTSALDGGEWSASRPGSFTPGKEPGNVVKNKLRNKRFSFSEQFVVNKHISWTPYIAPTVGCILYILFEIPHLRLRVRIGGQMSGSRLSYLADKFAKRNGLHLSVQGNEVTI
jgi:hypothetical protein